MRPGISIVTATFNRPAWLSCALRSALQQTFTDWELLVVGDACTDETAGVVAGFGDDRIRFVNLSRNFGEQAGPNNYGVASTSAPLVAFLNHDDVWLPHHLALCREVLLGESADLTFGTAAYVNAQSPLPLSFDSIGIGISGTGKGNSWSPAGVEASVAPASSWLMRREVFEKLRGWSLGRYTSTDPSQDFLFRVWRAGFVIRPVREVTVVMVTSGRRTGSYLSAGAPEQEWILEHLGDPGFACELAARAYESNEHFVARSESALTPALRLGGEMIARLGVSPRSLHFRLRKGFESGDYIKALRRGRGLPNFSSPRAEAPAIRFEMVRRSCRIDLPAGVDFAAGMGGARFLAHGWSRPEQSGVWSDGPEAMLLFDLGTRPAGGVVIDLELAPFLPQGVEARPVEVSVDGRHLETWSLDREHIEKTVRIDAGILHHSMIPLTFKFPATDSPKTRGLSQDGRELAVRFVRCRISSCDEERSVTGGE